MSITVCGQWVTTRRPREGCARCVFGRIPDCSCPGCVDGVHTLAGYTNKTGGAKSGLAKVIRVGIASHRRVA